MAGVMNTENIEQYIRDLDSSSYEYRMALADKLASFGEEAVPHLIEALLNENWMVRQDSAEILGRIGSPAAIDALESLLKDSEEGVKACAVEAIRKIRCGKKKKE
jgi:HEAT repeat protein